MLALMRLALFINTTQHPVPHWREISSLDEFFYESLLLDARHDATDDAANDATAYASSNDAADRTGKVAL